MSGEKDVFRCPSDEPVRMRGEWNDAAGGLPDSPQADNIAASYRMNISNQHAPSPDLAAVRPFHAVKITKLKDSSKAIVLFDGANNDALWHHAATWEISTNGLVRRTPLPQGFRDNVGWDKHRKRGMYVFADGHAENLLWEDTWQFVITDDGMWHQFPN
jgi:prepilin-type processing-associated H-X9-DG protein